MRRHNFQVIAEPPELTRGAGRRRFVGQATQMDIGPFGQEPQYVVRPNTVSPIRWKRNSMRQE